ncbi:hypothetical protein PsorP6_008113 [Peronosclerospora sorghi]|uniref:Uncharacterized protein n=1 Tax=Peronosclerospora sorghi TaxID=230839 RepID=A0ACC0W7C4_9STRA|nr:hypothetical protein PsorP6_008113 [Peronosclerospora sorghi]
MSVLGSGGVGKSALTLCFVRYYFVKDWNPCMLEILDTDFESLRGQWMMDKDGYVFVYSIDSRISLHELQPFFDLHLQINESRRPLPPIILVDNKKDVVEREPNKCQVSTEEGRRIAHSYNARYIEMSAFTGANVTAYSRRSCGKCVKRKCQSPRRAHVFFYSVATVRNMSVMPSQTCTMANDPTHTYC